RCRGARRWACACGTVLQEELPMAHPARRLHQRLETIHAVTYFAEESHAAAADLGLKGFWMGYFAFRAAPLGPARPPVVEAVVANFAPRRVPRGRAGARSSAPPRGR